MLLNEDKTWFIKGRFIRGNVRIIYDIMKFTEQKQILGLFMSFDFDKKTFVTISWRIT